jgi:hypothetical protein
MTIFIAYFGRIGMIKEDLTPGIEVQSNARQED